MSFHTWTVEEALWTLAALPGLVLWLRNRVQARKSLRAVGKARLTNGRRMWAAFAVRLTTFFIFTEVVYLSIGLAAGFTQSGNPSGSPRTILGFVVLFGLIGSSAGISSLAFAWLRVHNALLALVDMRDIERDLARDELRDPLRDEVRDLERDEERDLERDPLRDATRDVPRDEDRDVQRDVQRDPRRDTARDDSTN